MRLTFLPLLVYFTTFIGTAAPAEAESPQAERKLVPVNLALGKQVTASSEEGGKSNFARCAVDGSASTRWCAAGPESPQWLTIDLAQPEHLTGCELKWESPSAVYQYRLESSDDGKQWQSLVDKSANRRPGYLDRFDITARYLRVTFLGSESGGWASLWEVSLFGDKMTELDPRTIAAAREQQYLAGVKPPPGFDVTLVATPPLVNYPVFVAAAPDGTLYVSSDKNGSLGREPNRGSVVRLRDLDGDGRADESKRFVASVDSPRGLVWDHDRLYLMHPPHLSAFIDQDGDGIADEERVLVKNIAFGFKDRPADHTSNGVTLGIDGWLYLAIGDFGFLEAEGADGRKLQLRGGGVVRVRPDGSGLELYSRGTRNILEVALDPLLNGFARDNTNDGGGWDIRLHHFTGLEEHGYPSLFKHFTDEAIAPLADYGGGSGVGALYLDEPGFPDDAGRSLYTADWGREMVFRHPLKPKGATFEADQSEFLRLPRVTDLDADGLSRLYATSWKGAVFNYAGEDVGYVVRLSPQNYKPEPLPDFERANVEELVAILRSPSHRRRLAAQRALLRRGLSMASEAPLKALASDGGAGPSSRVAAIFTLKQGLGVASHKFLASLTDDAVLRRFAIRALADRRDELDAVPVEVLVATLSDAEPRTRLESAVALARLGSQRLDAAEAARALAERLDDADPIVAHTVVRALIRLNAADACFDVIDNHNLSDGRRKAALRVLAAMHTPAVANGLVTRLSNESDAGRRKGLLTALCRLYFCEGVWKGNSWGTRPDTSGPYYQAESWSETSTVEAALKGAVASAGAEEAAYLFAEMSRHKIHFPENLDRLLALAAADESMVPLAVNELAEGDRLPEGAAELALRALRSPDLDADVRARAARCLLRGENAAAFKAVLEALPELEEQGKRSMEFGRLTGALSDALLLSQHIELLTKVAASGDGRASLWADALLIFVSIRSDSTPEARDLATQALEKGWSDARRRRQILSSAELRNYREYEPRVRLALSDPDAEVAALARRIAKKWKLSAEAAPTGPPVKSLKAEDVLAAVLSRRGDTAVGEQLFGKLNCSKCHTIRADEPPRGPYLVSVAKTYKRGQLAEAVLLPNKSIAQGFATSIFLLDDGRTVIGFVTNEGADRVTVRDADGREHEIPVAAIEQRGKQELSVMPEGLAGEISVDEFASLISFLESLAEK